MKWRDRREFWLAATGLLLVVTALLFIAAIWTGDDRFSWTAGVTMLSALATLIVSGPPL